MRIEFFSDDDGTANVQFPGDAFAGSNEVILSIFYEYISDWRAKQFFEDVRKVNNEEMPISKQEDYDFGDYISGSMRSDFCVLEADLVKSNKYRVRTSSLAKSLNQWRAFQQRKIPGASELIEIDAEVID